MYLHNIFVFLGNYMWHEMIILNLTESYLDFEGLSNLHAKFFYILK